MDKISGIIPSSARVSSVDMKEAPPVRPGTPGFGRAEGVSSLREATAAQDTTAQKASGVKMDQLDWKTKDQIQAKLAEKVSDGFFMKNKRDAEPLQDVEDVRAGMAFQMSAPSKPAGFKSVEFAPIRISEPKIDEDEADVESPISKSEMPAQQPEGLYPRGSFIDRVA